MPPRTTRKKLPGSLPKDLSAWLAHHSIDEIEALVPDLTGSAKGKIIPRAKYQEDVGLRMPLSMFGQTVNGDYVAPLFDEGLMTEADSDIFLLPDAESARLVPFTEEPAATLIHDCFYADGSPVPFAPRQVLQHVLSHYEKSGWTPQIAPEMEFYLVKPNPDSDYPLEAPVGRSGRSESGRQSFSIDAVNEFEPLFEDLYNACETQRIGLETLIHEAGPAQMEVNLNYGNAVDLADQVFLFKRTLREVAMRHKIYATFMAAPLNNQPGSSMHIHQSLIDQRTGRNLFSTDAGRESSRFHAYIGGLQRYLPAALALMAPNINSFRRLGLDEFTPPNNTEWGYDNRAASLRIPQSGPEARRVENRLPGADVNPYLAIAASLACGYLGMREKLTPRPALNGSIPDTASPLPHTLKGALEELQRCEPLRRILGEPFVALYCGVKSQEYKAFMRVISAWEREHLLLNV